MSTFILFSGGEAVTFCSNGTGRTKLDRDSGVFCSGGEKCSESSTFTILTRNRTESSRRSRNVRNRPFLRVSGGHNSASLLPCPVITPRTDNAATVLPVHHDDTDTTCQSDVLNGEVVQGRAWYRAWYRQCLLYLAVLDSPVTSMPPRSLTYSGEVRWCTRKLLLSNLLPFFTSGSLVTVHVCHPLCHFFDTPLSVTNNVRMKKVATIG